MDFKTLKLSRWKKNQFLVAPDGYSSEQAHFSSPTYGCSAENLKAKWMSMINNQPRVILKNSDNHNMEYTFIQYSKIFRFPDYITVHFIALSPMKSTLAIFSRSRYGRRDFGVNERRIRSWLDGLGVN